MTSFSGRPGMRCGSQGNSASIRVKLGRQGASNMVSKLVGNDTYFRLGWLLRNLGKDSLLPCTWWHSNESSLKVQPSRLSITTPFGNFRMRRDVMFRKAVARYVLP